MVHGQKMTGFIFKLLQNVWDTETVLQNRKNASIVPLFKKGKQLGELSGAYLLSILDKILSLILLAKCIYCNIYTVYVNLELLFLDVLADQLIFCF